MNTLKRKKQIEELQGKLVAIQLDRCSLGNLMSDETLELLDGTIDSIKITIAFLRRTL
jgi:hypothetical protein